MNRGRLLSALTGALLLSLLVAGTALAGLGGLTQKPGTAGCISSDGSGGACATGRALGVPYSVAVSPDGRNTYVAGLTGIAVFDRGAGGALTQKAGLAGCFAKTGGGVCTDARNIDDGESIAISPDGASVYLANGIGGGVAIFDRNPATGALSQKPGTAGCVAILGLNGCAEEDVSGSSTSVAVSPDGKNVYLADDLGLRTFDRNPATGGLTLRPGRLGCYSDDGTNINGGDCVDGRALQDPSSVVVSPDGKSVYLATRNSDAVAIFTRGSHGGLQQKPGKAGCISNGGTGGACVNGRGLDQAAFVAVAPNGGNVYVAAPGDDAIAIFGRNAASGKLTQLSGAGGCVSETGSGGACADGRALNAPTAVTVSPGGASVYVTASSSRAVAIFDRSGAGTLTQQSGKAGCVSETGTGGACADGTGLDEASAVTTTPDGANVYVTAAGSNAISVFDRRGGTALPPGGGGGGGGGSGSDTTPPELKIDKKPKKKLETKHRKVEVKVKFSSEDGATFTCRLDKKDFKPCHSPYEAKLKAGRHKPKKHKIKVIATDAAGNSSDAETIKVKVERKRGKH